MRRSQGEWKIAFSDGSVGRRSHRGVEQRVEAEMDVVGCDKE